MREKMTGLLLAGLVFGAVACAGAKVYMTDGRPLDRVITVDGRADDWLGVLCSVEDGRMKVGFINDRAFLYVCLITEDESLVRRIKFGGLTVWFDPNGGQAKVLGIKYPLGLPKHDPAEKPSEEGGGPPPTADQTSAEPGSILEVIRPGAASPQKVDIADAKGLEIKAAEDDKLFVYELKIPLQTDQSPIGVGSQPGKMVGIGFEAPKPTAPKSSGSGREGERGGGGGRGPGSGGFGGMSGGMRGGRGGMHGGGMGSGNNLQMPEGLKFWTLVKLSTPRVPGMNAQACSGLTMSLASCPRLGSRSLATANGSKEKTAAPAESSLYR